MENQPEKKVICIQEVVRGFKGGLLKLYERGRKVLIPSLKMVAGIQKKGCFPLFTQLLSPSTAM